MKTFVTQEEASGKVVDQIGSDLCDHWWVVTFKDGTYTSNYTDTERYERGNLTSLNKPVPLKDWMDFDNDTSSKLDLFTDEEVATHYANKRAQATAYRVEQDLAQLAKLKAQYESFHG
jgi:hypothetical protein